MQETDLNKKSAGYHVIDSRGVACPLNFVKAKLELEKLRTGSILEVLLDESEPVRNVPETGAGCDRNLKCWPIFQCESSP